MTVVVSTAALVRCLFTVFDECSSSPRSLLGLVIFVGGLSLLCVLCGLGFVSLAISGTIIVSYVLVSSLVSYWFPPR